MQIFLNLYANPKRTEELQLNEEIRQIQDYIDWTQTHEVSLVNIGFVKTTDLLRQMQRHNPVLVHFSGHATETGELVLEDEKRKPVVVSGEALKSVFENFESTIKVVVLNCCYSADQAGAIADHIPCVVGMNATIQDLPGRQFSSKFLQSLVLGNSVKKAFDLAKTELALIHPSLSAIPKLMTRAGVDPAKVYVVSRPAIHAYFKDDLARLSVKNRTYTIKLMIHEPPAATSAVVYQLCDHDYRDFEDQFADSNNRRLGFAVEIEEYGDIEIRASLWGGDRPLALTTNLCDALTAYYQANENDVRAEELIESIRKYA